MEKSIVPSTLGKTRDSRRQRAGTVLIESALPLGYSVPLSPAGLYRAPTLQRGHASQLLASLNGECFIVQQSEVAHPFFFSVFVAQLWRQQRSWQVRRGRNAGATQVQRRYNTGKLQLDAQLPRCGKTCSLQDVQSQARFPAHSIHPSLYTSRRPVSLTYSLLHPLCQILSVTMPSITVADSFRLELPHGVPNAMPVGTHVSGHSTEISDPPAMGYDAPLAAWMPFAHTLLEDDDIDTKLRGDRLASWEETRRLLVEADVSDASAVQLMNPVDLAISAGHAGQISDLNQHFVQTTSPHSARADKCWVWYKDGRPNYFAVLDYKKVGTVVDEEFLSAISPPGQPLEVSVAQSIDSGGSSFRGNSRILVKQAVNYAKQYGTRYVAFFDWNCLVLLFLEDQEGLVGGQWCYVTLIRSRKDIRPALLAFLERAFQSSVLGEASLPRFGPYPVSSTTRLEVPRRSGRQEGR